MGAEFHPQETQIHGRLSSHFKNADHVLQEHLPAVGLISGTSLLTLAACIIYYKAAASAAVLLLAFVAILYSDELGACGGWALHHCAGVLASVRRGAPRAPFGPPAAPASESGACCRDVELRVIMNPRPGPQIP